MVKAVREGRSIRSVARQYGVDPSTVLFWVRRSAGKRLDRVDWSDRKAGPRQPWNRTAVSLERRVLAMRRQLRDESDLGEFGAPAIHQAMSEAGQAPVPSVATIGRVLKRRGAIADTRRRRRPPPPRGWWLAEVAAGLAELDSFDLIEDLKIQDGPLVSVLTATSLHGGYVQAWPEQTIRAREIVSWLIEHWRQIGLPAYAQFDNDTRFQGVHHFADAIGRVSRLCLSLGVIPVFAPPREPGFQNAIESFNGLWQAKVWQRFRYANLRELKAQSARYIQAHLQRSSPRRINAPPRRAFPERWKLDLQAAPCGTIIYLRRADDAGHVELLGHRFAISAKWEGRLVRCEVHLDEARIDCYGLGRRDPNSHPLLVQLPYSRVDKPFRA